MSEPVIAVSDLSKSYLERPVLNGIDFEVREGEVFGLLGPNGAGKSTTMGILSTLLPYDGGKVSLLGFDPQLDKRLVQEQIGYIPQELALYPSLSASDNLRFFGRIYGLRGSELEERVKQGLDMVGLRTRARDPVETFSGGMKRRLNVAAGMIHKPRILFFDEPTVGVDPQSRNFILEHVERVRAEGRTVVYTTHYMEEAARLCDRVAIMDQGKILALDTLDGLLDLLGGGVVIVGLADGLDRLEELQSLPHVRHVKPLDDRLKIVCEDTNQTLMSLIGLCQEKTCSLLSLSVLEFNLESVFLHLTGKTLRD